LLPSLSFSRMTWRLLRSPSGLMRGTRKQESPFSVCASVRKASHIGAEQNHLWPTSRKASPSRKARVVLARTSLPPCFSVIAMPMVTPRFSAMGFSGAS
jgi:hypothetical protein